MSPRLVHRGGVLRWSSARDGTLDVAEIALGSGGGRARCRPGPRAARGGGFLSSSGDAAPARSAARARRSGEPRGGEHALPPSMARAPELLATVSASDLGEALSDLTRALRSIDDRYMLIGGLMDRGTKRPKASTSAHRTSQLERPDLPEVDFVRTEWTQSTKADEFGRPTSGPRNTGCTTRIAGPHSDPASDVSGCGGPIRTAFSQ